MKSDADCEGDNFQPKEVVRYYEYRVLADETEKRLRYCETRQRGQLTLTSGISKPTLRSIVLVEHCFDLLRAGDRRPSG